MDIRSYIRGVIKESFSVEQLLSENKIYPSKIIELVTGKIGDSSEETLNKLAIAGLYRVNFGDIQQLKEKSKLDTEFNAWRERVLEGMVKTKGFYDNKPLAEKYLDAYVDNVRSLGDKARPFSLKKIEAGLVDVVNRNNWIEQEGSIQKNDIYNPSEGDILYEDDEVVILNSDTKAKCVMYGQGESWCITKPELNYYNTYRLSYGATPYFVLQKNVSGVEHKVVMMNYGSGRYSISDQSNSGKRAGAKEDSVSWSQVESELPNLKGLKGYFAYREITKDERMYNDLLEIKFDGNDMQGYIEQSIRGLIVNGGQVLKLDFIRDYAAVGHEISDEQVKSLDDTNKDSLIESGYFIRANQSHLLSPRQRARVARIKINNNYPLNGNEFISLSDADKKSYIKTANAVKISRLFGGEEDKEYIINYLLASPGLVEALDSEAIKSMIRNSIDKDSTINRLLKYPGFAGIIDSHVVESIINLSVDKLSIINQLFKYPQFAVNLDSEGIIHLLSFPDYADHVIKNLLESKVFMDKIDSHSLYLILIKSSKKHLVVDYLLKFPGFVENIDDKKLMLLINESPDESHTVNYLLEYPGFINRMDDRQLEVLIENSPNSGSVVRYLLKSPGFIEEINNAKLVSLLSSSSSTDYIINYLINASGFIENIDADKLYTILSWVYRGVAFSSEKESTTIHLLKYPKVVNTLDSSIVELIFMRLSREKKSIASHILSSLPQLRTLKMSGGLLGLLMIESSYSQKQIENLLDMPNFFEVFEYDSINVILQLTKNVELVVNRLLSSPKFISSLNDDTIEILLKNVKRKDEIEALLRPHINLQENYVRKLVRSVINNSALT